MEIVWHGLSCFRISERGYATVVTDPPSASVGLTVPRLKADIVTISHPAPGHSDIGVVSGYRQVLDRPGEYEIGGVFVSGMALWHGDRRNVHFRLDFGGVTVVHLGDLATVPSQSQLDILREANVLLLPVGGGKSLNAVQAAELVSLLEPNIVVPMHYHTPGLTLALDGVERFLKELGITEMQEESSLRITNGSLPEETRTVVLLPKG
jgi:L-ascorbate metabolism protein UlaG (beta-lactamase superfamily)